MEKVKYKLYAYYEKFKKSVKNDKIINKFCLNTVLSFWNYTHGGLRPQVS